MKVYQLKMDGCPNCLASTISVHTTKEGAEAKLEEIKEGQYQRHAGYENFCGRVRPTKSEWEDKHWHDSNYDIEETEVQD